MCLGYVAFRRRGLGMVEYGVVFEKSESMTSQTKSCVHGVLFRAL